MEQLDSQEQKAHYPETDQLKAELAKLRARLEAIERVAVQLQHERDAHLAVIVKLFDGSKSEQRD